MFWGVNCTLSFIMDVSLLIGVLSSSAHPIGGPLSFSATRPEPEDLGIFRAVADEATAATAERVLRSSIVSEVQENKITTAMRREDKGGESAQIYPSYTITYGTVTKGRGEAQTLITAGAISPPAWIEMLGIHSGYLPS